MEEIHAQNTERNTVGLMPPWQPGQSGNPGGRPKKNPVSDYLKEQLEAPIPQAMLEAMKEAPRQLFCAIYGDNPTFGQMVAFKAIQQAMKGDVFALKELLDRVEGKVAQKTVLEGEVNVALAERLKEARKNAERARAGYRRHKL